MRDLGLEYVELQSLWNKDVAKLTGEETRKVKHLVAERGMRISCIASRVFLNVPLRAAKDERGYWESYRKHMNDLENSIRIARELGTRIVRVFSFRNEILLKPAFFGDAWGMLLDRFIEPVKLAEREGVTLAVETCMLGNIGSCALAKTLVDDLGSRSFKILWDIANGLYLGERPYPDGYSSIRKDIVHIHIKDGMVDLPHLTFNFCALGEGEVRSFSQILRTLQQDGYQGVLSFECEYVPEGGTKEDALRRSVEYCNGLLASS
jgi:sugar phosphate isomerase/epimerase